MKHSLIFHTILTLIVCTLADRRGLAQQIQNTKQLIYLYESKLSLLMQMAEKQNISIKSDDNITNRTQHRSSLYKKQQQIIFQLNYKLSQDARYVQPNYVMNNSQILDINTNQVKYRVSGHVIAIQAYQITSRINNSNLVVANWKDKVVERYLDVKAAERFGKWHHATQFQDIFIQFYDHTLMLTNSKNTNQKTFKSQILDVFTINQYKIVYVTRYNYGYLNAKSLQINSQTSFQSMADSTHYSQGILFVLLKNRTLLTISQEQITSTNKIEVGLIGDNVKLTYLGDNYLFIHTPKSLCFDIFQIAQPAYILTYLREVCVINKFQSISQQNSTHQDNRDFHFQFFKNGEHYRFLVSDGQTQTKLYQINLPQKQAASEKSMPWKFILIIVCIVAVVYFKSNRSGSKGQSDLYSSQQRRPTRKTKKDRSIQQSGEQYIKNLTNQINKAKKYEAAQTAKKTQ